MAYVKKPKRKIKWKIAIPFISLIVIIIYMLVNILFPRPAKDDSVKICAHNVDRSYALLSVEYDQIYEISDYFFYGENLAFTKEKYSINKSDDLFGKTILLRNLCNDNKMLFQLTQSIDQQIDLGEIENGFYEVYVVNNLQEYRLTSKEEIAEIFHTITRNEASKKVEIIATDHYLKDKTLKHNYVYLNVTSDIIQHDSYDILIDPFGGNNDDGYGVRWGYQINELSENDEMYKAALILKARLESYGFNVGLTKNEKMQEINSIGENGRIHLGYNKNAKLYVNLQFNGSNYSSTNGIEITNSLYSSNTLPNQIIHDLEKNVGLKGSMLYPGSIQNGVYSAKTFGEDGTTPYDLNSVIRETGGIATGAGVMNETMRTKDAFATNNKNGMQALMIRLLYITNPLDYKLWLDENESIMNSIADSIAIYYQVELEGK